MMLALLLARQGLAVLVLEKHQDFLRDFRGDTVHPSTLEAFHELGILDQLLARPHQRAEEMRVVAGGLEVPVADLRHLPTHCRFIALMPQWDFLDFIRSQAAQYPGFSLMMGAEAKDLIINEGRITGIKATLAGADFKVKSTLVIAADGRHSTVRAQSKLAVRDLGAPIDVLWFRLPRQLGDSTQPFARFDAGKIFVMLNRGEYWQCGYVIAKDTAPQVHARGLPAFRSDLETMAAFMQGRSASITSWDEVKLLSVQVNRLVQWWRPGLLCIGDAAHAMSPVGGVGINLAIQDAIATANILASPLRDGSLSDRHLQKVQRRRELPTRLTQSAQLALHRLVFERVLTHRGTLSLPPLPLRILGRHPALRRIPGYLVGIGLRPEHVH
jgi:2-polyprenyl-6-methoxyphenol hydroxylase-like FAD-dependent oxidoreductase